MMRMSRRSTASMATIAITVVGKVTLSITAVIQSARDERTGPGLGRGTGSRDFRSRGRWTSRHAGIARPREDRRPGDRLGVLGELLDGSGSRQEWRRRKHGDAEQSAVVAAVVRDGLRRVGGVLARARVADRDMDAGDHIVETFGRHRRRDSATQTRKGQGDEKNRDETAPQPECHRGRHRAEWA